MIDNGKFIAEGPPMELIRKLPGRMVIELQEIEGQVYESLKPLIENEVYEYFGDTIYIFTNDPKPILDSLAEMNLPRVIERYANLEDLFLKLTGRSLRE